MYNKLFTKILDSSIWLAPDPHRLVWITLLAAMDEDGNAMFACVDNVAARARVTVEAAEAAIKAFESPDLKSGDPENEGRRIERFPGGWHVLNAHKYRSQVTKAIIREQTRVRVAEYRARNAQVTQANAKLTPSEADTEAGSKKKTNRAPKAPAATPDGFAEFWSAWPNTARKANKKGCLNVWTRNKFEERAQEIISHVETMKKSKPWKEGFEPAPLTYLNQERWADGVDISEDDDEIRALFARAE